MKYKNKPIDYYLGLDKRSKEYKDFKNNYLNNIEVKDSVGVGDIVEKVTTITGIKALVERFTPEGSDCGCDKRKEEWNKLRIYRKLNPKCLESEEFEYLKDFFSRHKSVLALEDQEELIKIYNRVFSAKLKTSSCSPCWKTNLQTLRSLMSFYTDIDTTQKDLKI